LGFEKVLPEEWAWRFLTAVRNELSNRARVISPETELIAADLDEEGAVVIIYSYAVNGDLVGRRYLPHVLRGLFDPSSSPEQIANFVVVDDVLEPSGRGQKLDVPWAVVLVEDPTEIGWIVAA
jgi:hypothetical protein